MAKNSKQKHKLYEDSKALLNPLHVVNYSDDSKKRNTKLDEDAEALLKPLRVVNYLDDSKKRKTKKQKIKLDNEAEALLKPLRVVNYSEDSNDNFKMAENSKQKHELDEDALLKPLRVVNYSDDSTNCSGTHSTDSSGITDTSAGDSDASDTEQEVEELDAVLHKLYQPVGDNKSLSVSHWSETYNDAMIRKKFRMRHHLVTPNDFLTRYLFSGDVLTFEEYFLQSAEVRAILNFVEKFTASADITENEIFLSDRVALCEIISQKLLDSAYNVLLSNTLDMAAEKFKLFRTSTLTHLKRVAILLKGGVHKWLMSLAAIVTASPNDVSEATYKGLFRDYLAVFNLRCVQGMKLGIPCGEMTISSVPDMLFLRVAELSQYCGVVEVKKMSLDPSFRHAFKEPQQGGILCGSGDGEKPSKKRRVNFQPDGAPGTTAMEESDEEKTNENQLDQTNGSLLTESARQFNQLFFGQLFESVLALDCCQPHGYMDRHQRLGIGVVGFRVVFLAFYSKAAVPFKDIPSDASNQMEVCVTSQLSLLNASDRKEIAKILLALSVHKPHKPTRK